MKGIDVTSENLKRSMIMRGLIQFVPKKRNFSDRDYAEGNVEVGV